ncbi:hypothetical protein DSO57_1002070 [Entomophthora muscae]|uniref:Uncharacterized protein n=1 Tax=Entomophthora muscae TaxID=34485 RepID=A0ACC2RZW9_9FUNG|nr:hypothetical protein DSO57_1002070 [Entomophthora muscae]
MVANLFAQMIFHVSMGNQSSKDKRLSPCATATYQPIKAMTDKEYDKWYMAAITHNHPASTPPPIYQPHPLNHRPLRSVLTLRLPSHTIPPTRHHSSPLPNKLPVVSGIFLTLTVV